MVSLAQIYVLGIVQVKYESQKIRTIDYLFLSFCLGQVSSVLDWTALMRRRFPVTFHCGLIVIVLNAIFVTVLYFILRAIIL